jgi:hypothetical protein
MQQIVDALASVIRNASIPSVRSVTTRPISDGLRADLDVIGFGSRTLYLHVTDTEATPSAPSSMAEAQAARNAVMATARTTATGKGLVREMLAVDPGARITVEGDADAIAVQAQLTVKLAEL